MSGVGTVPCGRPVQGTHGGCPTGWAVSGVRRGGYGCWGSWFGIRVSGFRRGKSIQDGGFEFLNITKIISGNQVNSPIIYLTV